MVIGLGVHPFIITLGTMWMLRGVAFVISHAESILVPASLTAVAKASLGTAARRCRRCRCSRCWRSRASARSICTRTVMGRHVFAVGGNAEASRFSGLRVNRIQLGVFRAVGAHRGRSRRSSAPAFYGSATSSDANGYELYVIASAVVGGASLTGGKGSALSAMLGALLIVMIRQAIRTLHLDQNYEWIIIGAAHDRRGGARPEAQSRSCWRRESLARRTPPLTVRYAVLSCIELATSREYFTACAVARTCHASPVAACGKAAASCRGGKTFRIAMIAKSSTNPVFLSARTGAEAAAAELSKSTGVDITIDWLTPPNEDGTVQAQRIAQAVNDGANAMLALGQRRRQGHRRDQRCGRPRRAGDDVRQRRPDRSASRSTAATTSPMGEQVMEELAKQMGGKGKIAILAGNQNAPNLQKRVQGVKEEAKKYPGITILNTFYHVETPQDAAAEVVRAQNAYPRHQRLGDDRRLAALHQGAAHRTRSDEGEDRRRSTACRRSLPYVEQGLAPVLFAQPTYQWGYVSVRTIFDHVHDKKDVPAHVQMDLVRVSKDNLGSGRGSSRRGASPTSTRSTSRCRTDELMRAT